MKKQYFFIKFRHYPYKSGYSDTWLVLNDYTSGTMISREIISKHGFLRYTSNIKYATKLSFDIAYYVLDYVDNDASYDGISSIVPSGYFYLYI